MRSSSITSPLLTLHDDALTEVALRLPAVKSKRPWRDMNSLATTCVRLYEWRKTKVNGDVNREWNRVKEKVFGTNDWRIGLKTVIRDYKNSPIKLFCEPILRKINTKIKSSEKNISHNECRKLKNQIFLHRESVSIKEIKDLIEVNKDSSGNTKNKILSKFPLFLTTLKSTDRQKALRMMFKLLDADKELGVSLKKNGIFKKIVASLDDDEPLAVLMVLGLCTRGLLTEKSDLGVLGLNIEFIPGAERWSLKSVPECLNNTAGMQAMLNDSACQQQLIEFLKKSFLECTNDGDKLRVCEKISRIYKKLDKFKDGKDLSQMVVKWILKTPLCISQNSNQLKIKYVDVLIRYLPGIEKCFGTKQKELLREKIIRAIKHSGKVKAYDHLTVLLIAIAKDNIKKFKEFSYFSVYVHDEKVLKLLLAKTNELRGSENQEKFVGILRYVVRNFFYSETTFFNDFMKAADKIVKNGSYSENKEYQGDGSTASES